MQRKDWVKTKYKEMTNNELRNFFEEVEREEKGLLAWMDGKEVYDYLLSKMNYCQRKTRVSGDLHLRKGDICYIDYGLSYICEVAYQHFGLILSLVHGKAFVVPMGGNPKALQLAKSRKNPNGKRHLMPLGSVEGLTKESVLYMNDAKWINTSRIIDVKAHIDVQSELFQEIHKRIIELI